MKNDGDGTVPGAWDSLVGDSSPLLHLRQAIERFAPFPRPVLIRGERGSGKELVAHLLHRLSPRAGKPFVILNSAAVSDGLMESEFFGHEKGSFTSSTARRTGRLEEAHGGTLFLDEVGNMPLPLQRMLLRVIEYQSFERVGGSQKVKVDVRFLAATNVDLEDRIRAGTFHADLYDRLRYAEIRVPPLRERKEDIPDLARFFLNRLRGEMPWISPRTISDGALVDLTLRPWQGNIRELRATVERAAVAAAGEEVRSEDLPAGRGASHDGGEEGSEEGFEGRVRAYERKLLVEALEASPDRKRAAVRLHLGYDQLRRLLRKHGL